MSAEPKIEALHELQGFMPQAGAMEVSFVPNQTDELGRPLLVMSPIEGFPRIELSKDEEQEALDFLRDAIAFRERNPLQ